MISKQAIAQFLRQPRKSFLWMKKLTHEDIDAEFKQYKVKPVFKGEESWLHQKICFHIGMCRPEFLFLLDMGTGKTKILLDIMTQVQREKKLQRALVTVNGQLTISSWEKAVEVHSDLEPILINSSSAEEKWEKLIAPTGDLAVIDYAGLNLALSKKANKGWIRDNKKVDQLKKLYNFFVADESHEAKNTDTLRFAILRALTKDMKYRYASTGTPMGRNPQDVFGQFLLVDHGETFSDTLGMFREAFFLQGLNNWGAREFTFDKKKESLFNEFMQHRSIRYTDDECGDIPPCKVIPLNLDFTPEQREHYLNGIEGLINAGGKLSELENAFCKLRQILSGYMNWKDQYGEHTVKFSNNPKLEMLEILLADSDGKFVVFYEYTHSGKLITDKLKELKIEFEWVWGGDKDKIGSVDSFKTKKNVRVLVAQNKVGSTGVDGLQDVARYVVFFESPCSPIVRKQAEKRLYRSGQLKRVFIYDLIIKSSIDVRILGFIKEGRDLQASLIDGSSNTKQLLLL